jgi:hypothetical protein
MKWLRKFLPWLSVLGLCLNFQIASAAEFTGLPDTALTPGATNPAVTELDIGRTICVSGYTGKIRPPVSYTNKLKLSQLESGYTVLGDINPSFYEEDHLIPLELGGNPTSAHNLWPEPWSGTFGAHAKDKLENKLHALVCSKKLALSQAQREIAQDWVSAYKRYFDVVSPTPIAPPTPTATQTSTSLPTIPAAPTPLIQQPDVNDVIITIATLTGFDSASMTLVLSSTSAIGNCPKLLTVTSLPFSETCSGLASKQVWVIDTSMKSISGKSVGNYNFSSAVTFTSFPPIASVTPTSTPTQTPTPTASVSTATQNPTPAATQTSATVYPGAFCSPGGATGVSAAGKSYTCKTSATDTRLRWRQ